MYSGYDVKTIKINCILSSFRRKGLLHSLEIDFLNIDQYHGDNQRSRSLGATKAVHLLLHLVI